VVVPENAITPGTEKTPEGTSTETVKKPEEGMPV